MLLDFLNRNTIFNFSSYKYELLHTAENFKLKQFSFTALTTKGHSIQKRVFRPLLCIF